MEEWREVLGYDTLYEVSNFGRVRTRRNGVLGYQNEYRMVEPRDNGKGYLAFNWKVGGRQKTAYVHRLVAEAFIPNPEKLEDVNHKDENKENNHVDNLEWVSHRYNCNYGNRNVKTAHKNSKPVICLETGVKYESATSAAEQLGICVTSITNCLNGRSKSCMGYHWRYV